MTWEEAEKFVASVLDRMEHESIQEAARRLLDLDATFAEMVAGVNTRDATIAALRAENIRLRGEVDMYKGALEMMQPAPKEQAEHGMGAMPPVPDEVAQLRAEVERAKSIIENYELDYDRVVVRGEKCAMEQAVEEAATLRAEVERLKKREEAWIDLSRENNEHYDELNKLCDTFGPNTEGDTYHGFLSKHITQLREDRRVLANECEAWRLASGNKPEDVGDRWKALYVTGGEWRWQPLAAADATDASGALGRAT